MRENEIVALLGTNGAGKSTLLKGICGLVKPTAGTVQFAGEDVTSLTADVTTHRGVSLMPGGKGVFPTLSVTENLRLAAWLIRDDPDRVEAAKEGSADALPDPRAPRRRQLAGDLSGGEQQMLALGAALMTKPRLLMIDELSLGLAPTIVAQLLEVVKEIHSRGTTIVLVEQSVNVALEPGRASRVHGEGRGPLRGPDRRPARAPRRAALGVHRRRNAVGPRAARPRANGTPKAAKAKARVAPGPDAPVLLETMALLKRYGGITAVDDVDLQLREGEILGLIGHNGAGKTTLMDCISGFNALDGGRIFLQGDDITEAAPHERALGGLGRSFQDALLFPIAHRGRDHLGCPRASPRIQRPHRRGVPACRRRTNPRSMSARRSTSSSS